MTKKNCFSPEKSRSETIAGETEHQDGKGKERTKNIGLGQINQTRKGGITTREGLHCFHCGG